MKCSRVDIQKSCTQQLIACHVVGKTNTKVDHSHMLNVCCHRFVLSMSFVPNSLGVTTSEGMKESEGQRRWAHSRDNHTGRQTGGWKEVVGGALPGALEEAKAGQVLDVDNGLGGLDVVADDVDGKDLHGCR